MLGRYSLLTGDLSEEFIIGEVTTVSPERPLGGIIGRWIGARICGVSPPTMRGSDMP
jgi:hypothetical protein